RERLRTVCEEDAAVNAPVNRSVLRSMPSSAGPWVRYTPLSPLARPTETASQAGRRRRGASESGSLFRPMPRHVGAEGRGPLALGQGRPRRLVSAPLPGSRSSRSSVARGRRADAILARTLTNAGIAVAVLGFGRCGFGGIAAEGVRVRPLNAQAACE